jgi:UDP:flavonoid glycosyltransferase YjiC (YdhE family)
MAKVLFFAEAVTLAHVARCLVLADALHSKHDVSLAVASTAQRHVPENRFRLIPLESIPGERFVEALRRGQPVYDEATLRRYVEDDLRLIDEVRPDVVVGDFRLSLSVSARVRGVPYVGITNAYWSPWYRRAAPLPVLPWTGVVPLAVARPVFALGCRPIMASHSRPLNRVRSRYGLPPLGTDLRRVYSDADHVAYADVPELHPTPDRPVTHQYLGPILWSPPVTPPAWWGEAQSETSAYVTMGSSGDPGLLGVIVKALDELGVTARVATAGAAFTPPPRTRARIAAYLPGIEAARRADFVVCNGGSLTVQQALSAGKPVLGIASNMDQFLNMQPIVEAGAGIVVRADRASRSTVLRAAARLLHETGARTQAHRLSGVLARYSAANRFAGMIDGILAASDRRGAANDEKDPALANRHVPRAARAGVYARVE